MANEISVYVEMEMENGILVDQIGQDSPYLRYSVDQRHAAMRRFTKRVRGLPFAETDPGSGRFAFGIGDDIDMDEQRRRDIAGLPTSDLYKFNFIDFGEDLLAPGFVTFFNLGSKYPVWLCSLYRATAAPSYTVVPFLEVPPEKVVGPIRYPQYTDNSYGKSLRPPLWFAMIGTPKSYEGDPTELRQTLYIVAYDS